MKRRIGLWIVGAIVVLAAAVVALNLTLGGSRDETALPTRAATVARGTLRDRVSGNGTFVPRTAVSVGVQVSGEVREVRVEENDLVRAGDVLLTLREDDYALAAAKMEAALESARRGVRQSLVSLRAQYRSARAALSDAQRAVDKNRELVAAKSISEEAWQRSQDARDSAQVALQSAREQLNLRCGLPLDAEPPMDASGDDAIVEDSPEVAQALLSLRSARDSVARCVVTAPIGGTVTRVTPSTGDVVAPGAPLVRIEDLGSLRAQVQVDEVDIGTLRVGQAAEVTSDSLIGTTLRGTVESIAPTVTSLGATRASLVDVRIDAAGLPPGAALRSGASCTARITTSIRSDALLVPLTGFITEGAVSAAFVLAPTGRRNAAGAEVFQLERREITTGSSDVNNVEVRAGLSEGERVAVGSLRLLRDGILVTVRGE